MFVFVVSGFASQGKISSFAFKFRKKYSTFANDDVVFIKSKSYASSYQN